MDYNITIRARYLQGQKNQVADKLSRRLDHHEWMLARSMIAYLDSLWGPHTIDRFASALSTQLPKYNTRYLDPNGMGIDALAQLDWGLENNYVNPPIRLLKSVMNIIRNQKAEATVIAPWWPAQTWFQDLKNMSVCPPVRVSNRAVIPLNPAIPEPWKNRRWKIFAWRVCGNLEHWNLDGLYVQHRA